MPTTVRYQDIYEIPFHNVSVDKLVIGSRLPFDVYIKDEHGITRHIFNKGTLFTKYAKEVVDEKGLSEIYLDGRDSASYEDYFLKGGRAEILTDEDPKVFKEYTFNKDLYYHIDTHALVPGTRANFSLFLLRKMNISILAEGSEKSPAVIDDQMLSQRGDILIKKTDIPLYIEYLKSKPTNIGKEAGIAIIKENSKIIVKDLIEDPRSGEKIKESIVSVNDIIDTILKNWETIYDLMGLRSYDYYTYTHCVNVAIMSVGLGIAMGLERNLVEKLGIGAMLHDIGKSVVDSEILNKQGRLNFTEFRIIKTHVSEGEKILRTHKEIPDESFDPVLQHHEKLNGKGYPMGLAGREIKLFGRITEIVDCYDALTTNRPYKTAYTPYFALSLMVKEKKDYDCDILKEFIGMLKKTK